MGLGDVSELVVPKVGLIAPPRSGGVVSSRYLTPLRLHAAHAVTGGICVGAAAMLDGTIAAPLADRNAVDNGVVRIEHPSGSLDVTLVLAGSPEQPTVESAGIVRTARKILDGGVFVPAGVWK